MRTPTSLGGGGGEGGREGLFIVRHGMYNALICQYPDRALEFKRKHGRIVVAVVGVEGETPRRTDGLTYSPNRAWVSGGREGGRGCLHAPRGFISNGKRETGQAVLGPIRWKHLWHGAPPPEQDAIDETTAT